MSPPQYLLLPREPTPGMLKAARPAMREVEDRLALVQLRGAPPIDWPDGKPPLVHAYRAMVAAYEQSVSPGLRGEVREAEAAALDIATAALEKIANRGAGPLGHRLECKKALAKIATLRGGEGS